MMKINLLVLQVLLGLARGVTQAIFAVLGFYPVIVDKVSRKYLYACDCGKPKRWAIVGSLRILGTIILPLTALLAVVLGFLHRLILGLIRTLFTGENV
jgi:hypothetical protein